MNGVENEAPPEYGSSAEERIVAEALGIIGRRINASRDVMSSPDLVKSYLCLRVGAIETHEVFGLMLLDAQNRVIDCLELFRGTLTQTSVYPREVVRLCLSLNAAAVVLYHNHPSGTVQPSRADEALTETLKQALALVDVRVLDHIVVAGSQSLSFAERGLL